LEETKRKWGMYDVFSKTKILRIEANKGTSLQYHNHKTEFWYILDGSGFVTIGNVGNQTKKAKKGDSFYVNIGQKHQILAGDEGMTVLEVATGDSVLEEDKVSL
jgi:mannose-6-phosphate isomerase